MAIRRIGQRAGDTEVVLELSLWDALALGRVSATRRGLRVRVPSAAPSPTTPSARLKEVA